MSSATRKQALKNKSSSDAKTKKQSSASKPTKNDNTAPNNTMVGSDQDFLFTGQSLEQKEDEWLNKFQHMMKIKKNKVDESSKFSDNLKRLYDALLKELSIRCGQKYESVFGTAGDGHSEIEMTMNVTPRLSSQAQELQQMQQKIDALTKEKADVLKQNENLEKGNVTQGKTDSSNKEQITSLTDENRKIKLKHKELEQQQINLQQQQREESQRSKEKINMLTAENESLVTVVSQIEKQVGQEVDHHNRKSENLSKNLMSKEHDIMDLKRTKIEIERSYSSLQKQIDEQTSTIKRLEEEKRKINKEKMFAALDPDQKLKEVQEENEKLRNRLWEVTGIPEDNPALADLGDPNRPTQLGEKFAEMYDNEWTDAMDELGNAGDEKSNINTLKTIVEKSYEFGKSRAASYVKGLEKAFLDLSNGIEVTDISSKYIKNHRKNTALLVLDGLYKSFVREHKEYNVGGDGVKSFIKKAVSLCWLMAIQDPPVVLTTKLTGKFDTDRFRHYINPGSTVDYVVWPVLFLHEGGPIICKGVAEGK